MIKEIKFGNESYLIKTEMKIIISLSLSTSVRSGSTDYATLVRPFYLILSLLYII
jgi:hypothetical protein